MKFLKLILIIAIVPFLVIACTEQDTTTDKSLITETQSEQIDEVQNIFSINNLENTIFTNNENGFETFLSFKEGYSEQNGTMVMSQLGCQYVFNVTISKSEIDAVFFKSTCGNESSDTRLHYDKMDNSLSMKIKGQTFFFYSEFSNRRPKSESVEYTNEEEVPEYDEAEQNRQQEQAEYESSQAYYNSLEEESEVLFKTPINRNPEPRLDYANVFWKTQFTLFDNLTDEPIYPYKRNGEIVYKIYCSTNETLKAEYLELAPNELQRALVYKFNNLENCNRWIEIKKRKSQKK
jgi:hypothetical protein